MLLTIHDASLRKVAFIDNDKQATLNYFNDSWTRYLETGSSTFDFTVFKKDIISDTGQKRAYNCLNEKAFVSFQYKGKTYLHTIRKIEENEKIIKCYGINLNLELINEYANPYKSPRAMTFKEFCDAMDLLNFTFLKIGINEVATQKISAEWEGTDTKLNRLLSLANKFGAEIEFDTYLNADSSIKSFVVNVYHEHDDNNQGVGRVSPTILKYGKNLKTLTRTVDKTNIYNMVRPTGKDDQGNVITISGLGAWSVNNEKGEREFYQSGEGLYAPLSMQMYPAAFTSNTMGDQWIRKDMTVESSNPEVIRSTAYRELKKNCYPAVTYEAEGFADLDIGDTVQVYDDGFSPTLLLEMRVSEQAISFTNPKNNKTTFSNAKALENRLSGGIQQRLDQMIEDAKPYTIKVATDNGVGFKNGQGQSVVTPTLMKGNRVINSGWRWVVNGIIKSTSPSYIVKASDVYQTLVVTVAAWIDNQEVASEQITFINTVDGTAGKQGPKGDPGQRGDDGRTPYIHWAYSDNADGTGLTMSDNGQRYIGHYSDYTQADSTDKTKYRWADRWAKISVGGENLLINSQFDRTIVRNSFTVNGVTYNQGAQDWGSYNSGIQNPTTVFHAYVADAAGRSNVGVFNESNGGRNWKGFSQEVLARLPQTTNDFTFSVDCYATGSGTKLFGGLYYYDKSGARNFHAGKFNLNVKVINNWHRLDVNVPFDADKCDFTKSILFFIYGYDFTTNSILYIDNVQLETGTVATAHRLSQAEIALSINSKADQTLTQEQLNALNEKAGLLQAELEAKASLDTVNNILKQIKDMKAADEATWAKVEKDLITHLQRVIKIETNLGDRAQRWNAVDTFMQVSNDGLSLGKADGSSSMLFSPDGRITMFSSGTPVMYVYKGVIHIDNGIFSKTVQIGRFREEQYHNNPDINVKRYVGG